VSHGHPELVTRREAHGADAVEAREVLRIFDGDDEESRPPFDRRGAVFFPDVRGDALHEVFRDGLRRAG